MPFQFQHLDAQTRRYMVEEIEAARREGNLYFSKRFTPAGDAGWPSLLLDAARNYDEHWLAYKLEVTGFMEGFETSATPSGGYTLKHVPGTAAETMAEGQFNRYYMLGLCRRAIDESVGQVAVYRAKPVANPRDSSNAMLGSTFTPADLIKQIRPLTTSLGHALLKPNSGLSISY